MTTTLNKLIEFTLNDDTERAIFEGCKTDVLNEYLADTKSTWSNGTFYLGGFIKMNPDDEITLKKIEEVKIIRDQRYKEYGGPCNSWEAASIWRSERQLDEIELLVKKHSDILKYRYLKELEKTKLNNDVNNDVNNVIVSFTL
jgi:hypothetical protein